MYKKLYADEDKSFYLSLHQFIHQDVIYKVSGIDLDKDVDIDVFWESIWRSLTNVTTKLYKQEVVNQIVLEVVYSYLSKFIFTITFGFLDWL